MNLNKAIKLIKRKKMMVDFLASINNSQINVKIGP